MKTHGFVFPVSASIILALVTLAAIFPGDFAWLTGQLRHGLVHQLGWFYVVSMTGFLVFAIWLVLGRFGSIRLGDDRPQFNRVTWFAMLFSAGMGVGLMFFGVAEPMMHFVAPPDGPGMQESAARHAMALTFFHWGLHAWGVYSVVGLCFAYFSFRQGLPLSVRSALHPLIGERIHGRIGDLVDVLAVVCTMFGVATSLGLGAMQINAGLKHTTGLLESVPMQLAIIAIITFVATLSVVSGLDLGIRRLSELNVGLATCLMLIVFISGPTSYLILAFADNVAAYVEMLPSKSFRIIGNEQFHNWLDDWTVFYWAWWISWSPFVGMFIARISRGRSIREFVVSVLFVPTIVGFVWLTVFGNSALFQEPTVGAQETAPTQQAGGIQSHQKRYGVISDFLYPEVVDTDGNRHRTYDADRLPRSLFVLLQHYPLSEVTSFLAITCVILFFVTSSDSASLVIDTIASGGATHPGVALRIYWAVKEGAVASFLLLCGGLSALQSMAIASAFPFCLVIMVMCFGLARALWYEQISMSTKNRR